MTPSPAMQACAAKFCESRVLTLDQATCGYGYHKEHWVCERDKGRPDCPFLAELLALMPEPLGETVRDRTFFEEGKAQGLAEGLFVGHEQGLADGRAEGIAALEEVRDFSVDEATQTEDAEGHPVALVVDREEILEQIDAQIARLKGGKE